MAANYLRYPQSQFLDPVTKRPAREWLIWLQNPNVATITAGSGIVSAVSGGSTGLTPATATQGAVTLGGTVNVASGGTGVSTLTGYVKGAGTTPLTASATIPSTDVSGLGTMATQNASSVAITGGSVNGVSVTGATITNSPISGSSVSATTLTTSSTVTVNNLAATGTHTIIAKWLPVVCDGTTYYLPLYT
jgi:hypothetical protein